MQRDVRCWLRKAAHGVCCTWAQECKAYLDTGPLPSSRAHPSNLSPSPSLQPFPDFWLQPHRSSPALRHQPCCRNTAALSCPSRAAGSPMAACWLGRSTRLAWTALPFSLLPSFPLFPPPSCSFSFCFVDWRSTYEWTHQKSFIAQGTPASWTCPADTQARQESLPLAPARCSPRSPEEPLSHLPRAAVNLVRLPLTHLPTCEDSGHTLTWVPWALPPMAASLIESPLWWMWMSCHLPSSGGAPGLPAGGVGVTDDDSWAGRGWRRLQFDEGDVEPTSCVTRSPPASSPAPHSSLGLPHHCTPTKSQRPPAAVAVNPESPQLTPRALHPQGNASSVGGALLCCSCLKNYLPVFWE